MEDFVLENIFWWSQAASICLCLEIIGDNFLIRKPSQPTEAILCLVWIMHKVNASGNTAHNLWYRLSRDKARIYTSVTWKHNPWLRKWDVESESWCNYCVHQQLQNGKGVSIELKYSRPGKPVLWHWTSLDLSKSE